MLLAVDHERGILYVNDAEKPKGIMPLTLVTGEGFRDQVERANRADVEIRGVMAQLEERRNAGERLRDGLHEIKEEIPTPGRPAARAPVVYTAACTLHILG